MGAVLTPLPPGAVCPDPWKMRLAREKAGLTQADVGYALGFKWPAMYVSRLESYQQGIKPAEIGRAHV